MDFSRSPCRTGLALHPGGPWRCPQGNKVLRFPYQYRPPDTLDRLSNVGTPESFALPRTKHEDIRLFHARLRLAANRLANR